MVHIGEENKMKAEDEIKARKLAEEHWAWVESVLTDRQQETKHMAIEFFKHGFKHGKEE